MTDLEKEKEEFLIDFAKYIAKEIYRERIKDGKED